MKCYYEADDGTIFENMENCLKYEEEQKKRYEFKSIFRNKEGKKIPLINEDGDDNYDSIFYVTIISREEAERMTEVFDEYGWSSNFLQTTSKSYPQNFYYEISEERWKSFDGIKNKYFKLAKIFEED